MARWDELFLEPAAPVLLRGLTIVPTRARYDDFDLVLDETPEVNPVLLHKLAAMYGADTDGLAELAADPDQLWPALRKAATAAEIPGFDIGGRRVIGTFTYAKLPTVRDLFLPRLAQRPGPGPAAQGAPGTPRLDLPPHLVDQLVHRPRRRGGQDRAGLPPGRGGSRAGGRAGRPAPGCRGRARAGRAFPDGPAGSGLVPGPVRDDLAHDGPAGDGRPPPGPGQAIARWEPASPQRRLPPG
jgi:hypothetical protein